MNAEEPHSPSLLDLSRAMARDWNQRAEEDARHYIAAGESKGVHFSLSGLRDSLLLLEDLFPYLEDTTSVLEIGCGIGRLLRFMAAIFPEVHGIDVSEEMIERGREYMAAYPDLHVELVLNDRQVDPIEEGFDVTLRIAEPRSSTSLVSIEIAPVPRMLCASPAYLDEHGVPSDPRELRDHRCLHYGYQESGSRWRLHGPSGDHTVAINCVMWSNNGDVLYTAALKDQGIVLLPDFILAPALEDGRLTRILTAYSPPPISLCALYPRHRHLSRKVRLFVDAVAERFRTGEAEALRN